MERFRSFELKFYAQPPEVDFVSVNLYAEFICNGKVKTVKGFYDGDGIYKIRFLPEYVGVYSWSVYGIVNSSGCETCVENDSPGLVKAVSTHFEYQNGEIFTPFGTTVYALVHQNDQLVDETIKTIVNSPFNKVRHCIFPKHFDYNNEDPELYPFEIVNKKINVKKPCFKFWRKLENCILRLAQKGVQSDLILFHLYDKWGFACLSKEENHIYLDYLLRRFASYPEIWFSIANEYDLVAAKSIEDWYDLEQYIVDNDIYGHLLSCHNCTSFYDFTRKNITHCSVQSNQLEWAAKWIEKYNKPLIYDECCYEGNIPQNWGNISGFELVNRFWKAYVLGAYATHGETFLDKDEIIWWSKGGELKGKSTARIAFLKDILSGLEMPVQRWVTNPAESLDPQIMEYIKSDSYRKLVEGFQRMSDEQKTIQFFETAEYKGRHGDDYFIQYFARHCNAVAVMCLPTDKNYSIDVIDVYEMTKTRVYSGVSGKIMVSLPGKEGMAVLAIKE